ncbi:MFS transporter [Actinocrispum wychmicini]|uniref:Putative MFS family arabinose efflux permease n=1 Tax=Actinocrispum wychmicini TaxID=1213861 RepID=A0A4V2S7N7_9PSEU|nr:MFS transporter [Actinocrispum wychmicini]TCO60670.1 putative MFS family arabinose efflux permease [Actinocrispum wychmicini]
MVADRFRVVAGAYAVSSYGSYLNLVALNLLVYQTTGNAFDLGLFMVVRLLSGVAAGVVAPAMVGRFTHKQVMLWANVAQGALLVLLVLWPHTAVLFAVAAANGCGTTLFLVALRSTIPDLVGPARTSSANSLVITCRSVAMVGGFASAGIVVSTLGFNAAFLVDAATFGVCAVAVAWLRVPARKDEPAGAVGTPSKRGAWLLRLGSTLIIMLCLRALDGFGSSSHNVALPVYSAAWDQARPSLFASIALASWALGTIVAQVAMRLSRRQFGARAFTFGTIMMSSAFILTFAGFPMAVTAVIALVAGCADGFTELSYTTYLQAFDGTVRDRLFGLSAVGENFGFGLGMIINAVLLEHLPPFPVVAISHGVVIPIGLVVLAFLIWTRGGDRRVGSGHRDHRNGVQVPGS